MLALMAARFGGKAMREVLEGNWPSMPWSPLLLCGRPFTGRTFGFVGFGRIAQGSWSDAQVGVRILILRFFQPLLPG